MTASLVRAGVRVLAYDRSEAALAKAVAAGAHAAESPQAIGATPGVTAVVSMLPSTEHVQDAYQGPQGLLQAPGGLVPPLLVDCSTILPTASSRLAAHVASAVELAPGVAPLPNARGPVFVDAPVSGGVAGAAAGTLTFMCGGTPSAVEAAAPLLLLMGSRVEHVGGPGAGAAAKVANNLALGVAMAGLSEALALGVAMGLDAAVLARLLNASTARCWAGEVNNPIPGVVPAAPASRGYTGGFNAALMSKDLRLAMSLAAAAGSPLHMGERAAQLYAAVSEEAGGPVDFSAIYKYVYRGGETAEKEQRAAASGGQTS